MFRPTMREGRVMASGTVNEALAAGVACDSDVEDDAADDDEEEALEAEEVEEAVEVEVIAAEVLASREKVNVGTATVEEDEEEPLVFSSFVVEDELDEAEEEAKESVPPVYSS